MQITYDEYDRVEEVCDAIREENEKPLFDIDEQKMYSMLLQRPTMAQLREMDVANNFDLYFPYLFFYYTQKFDSEMDGDAEEYRDYKEVRSYISRLMKEHLEFVDED